MNQLQQARDNSLADLWISSLTAVSKLDRVAVGMLRMALVIVLVWIGGLKFVDYEADSIVPLVAQSPMMKFFIITQMTSAQV